MINIKCILRTERNLFQQAECYMIPFLFSLFSKKFYQSTVDLQCCVYYTLTKTKKDGTVNS